MSLHDEDFEIGQVFQFGNLKQRHNVALFELQNLELFKFFESIEDILLNQKLDKDILKPDLLNSFLKTLVRKDHIIGVTINEEDSFILDLSMTSSDACCFQVLLLASI